ncbi:ORC1-type DNA replication protein [Candidatus Altiarchaeota archaeon]
MKPRDLLLAEETLFRDESVFTPSYVPADFQFREDQIRELTLNMKPGLRGVNPINTLVYGPPGTGKTTAIKYLLQESKDVSGKLLPVYINCEDHSTLFSIFSRIHEELLGHRPPETGKPLETVKEKIFKKLKKEGKSLLVALDEIDHLFVKNTADKVLLDLLKTQDTYGYGKVGVFGILVEDQYVVELKEKTRSVFNPQRVFFSPYTREETKAILDQRIKYGLYAGVIVSDTLDLAVDKTIANGDLRVGIDLLRKSAYLAERDASRKIKPEHIEKAYDTESKILTLKKSVRALDEISLSVLNMLARSTDGSLDSNEIFQALNETEKVDVKKYSQVIKRLEFYRLVDSAYQRGKRGRSRTILLRSTPSDIKEALQQINEQ